MHYILGALCKIHTFAKKWTPLMYIMLHFRSDLRDTCPAAFSWLSETQMVSLRSKSMHKVGTFKCWGAAKTCLAGWVAPVHHDPVSHTPCPMPHVYNLAARMRSPDLRWTMGRMTLKVYLYFCSHLFQDGKVSHFTLVLQYVPYVRNQLANSRPTKYSGV